MIISQKTQSLCFDKDVNDLLCQIDVKLSKIAETKYNGAKYGEKVCIDEESFFVLSNYRKILIDKANNSKCLCNYLIDDIMSNIRQYISSGKVTKFKKF